MTLTGPGIVQAAGAVCWRQSPAGVEVLLVHRTEHSDTGLPKGKVDPGETPPQTAVREIAEEAGLAITLGAPLGQIDYVIPGGREKVVHFWSAEVSDEAVAASTFSPNREIAAVEWLSIDTASTRLSYDLDREVLNRFKARVEAGTTRTFALILLRHAKAVPPASWDGPDATRPLLHRGLELAENIAPAIAAWAPTKLISSPAARCLATVDPITSLTGLPVKVSGAISQDSFEEGTLDVRKIVEKRIRKRATAVICSHGPVIAELISEIAAATNTPLDAPLRRAGMLSTAEFTVLHFSLQHPSGPLVATETHGPAFA